MSPVYAAPRASGWKVSFEKAPVVPLRKPALWPGAAGGGTEVRAAWNERGLHVAFRISGKFSAPQDDPKNKRTIANDDRVEVFVWPPRCMTYYGYEINRAGRILDYSAWFMRKLDFSWHGTAKAFMLESGSQPLMTVSIPWTDLGIPGAPPKTGIRIGFYRGETFLNAKGERNYIWTCWVDPGKPEINFHRPETFGDLLLR